MLSSLVENFLRVDYVGVAEFTSDKAKKIM